MKNQFVRGLILVLGSVVLFTGCGPKTPLTDSSVPGESEANESDISNTGETETPGGLYQELLKNADFQDGLNGWAGSDWLQTTEGGRYGNDSIEVQASVAPGERTILSQEVVIPETGYYTAKAPVQGNGNVSGTLDVYDEKGEVRKSAPVRMGQWYYETVNAGIYCEKGEKVRFQIELTASSTTGARIAACSFTQVSPWEEGAEAGQDPVSYLAKREDGSYYPVVGGKPFLYNMIQDGYFTEEVAKKVVEAGYTAVCVWVRWAQMEPKADGPYDFTEIDEYLRIAEKYDLKLSINWGGSNFCGGLWSEFPPSYITAAHQYHQKDARGTCEIGFSGCHVANVVGEDGTPETSYMFQRESKALAALLSHLNEADPSRSRVVDIQLLNEPVEATFTTSQKLTDLAAYINALGKVVKESEYSLITRVNTGFGTNINSIFNTQYIDMNGLDSYSRDVRITTDLMENTFDSRFAHIAETCTFDNTTAHMFASFAGGGGYHIYSLIQDVWNNKMDSLFYFQVEYKDEKGEWVPFSQQENSEFMKVWDNAKPNTQQRCLDYNKPYEERVSTVQGYNSYYITPEHTKDITAVNKALAQIGEIVAAAPTAHKAAFNVDCGAGTPNPTHEQTEKIGEISVGFSTTAGACGMAVLDGNTVYCVADRNCSFTVNGETKQATPGTVLSFTV